MNISVRVHDVKWTAALQAKIERSISFALDRFDGHVRGVDIYVADLNGPKGGVDKLCQLTAILRRSEPVVIVEKGDRVVPMVNRAVRRLAYRVGRKVQRLRPATRRDRASVRTAVFPGAA